MGSHEFTAICFHNKHAEDNVGFPSHRPWRSKPLARYFSSNWRSLKGSSTLRISVKYRAIEKIRHQIQTNKPDWDLYHHVSNVYMGAFLTQATFWTPPYLIAMVFELISNGFLRPSKLSLDFPVSRISPGEIKARSQFYSLFSALLHKQAGFDVTIFEVEDRVGGRVKTHYLEGNPSSGNWQYCEFGAMRLPFKDHKEVDIKEHKLVFTLIKILNDMNKQNYPVRNIELINFIFSCDKALTYFNDIKVTNAEAEANPRSLGFPTKPSGIINPTNPTDPPIVHVWTIQDLWKMAVHPFIEKLHENFEEGKKYLFQYDGISVRAYLTGVPVKSASDDGVMLNTFHIPLEEIFIASIETFT
ncbi:hypothetical protein BC938DRAFT_483248 [Jimgerdemannia flammicorona]|uniref:Amine oxidase domain-containing protein n=1 Tax=Jimgerdemannia flammicorona TaxID=994334 RepID=A0A433QCA0_9FUNG|nr:hypothetical protein BC938DRAFT_483248 [Jimgerdemannia flammicorona]